MRDHHEIERAYAVDPDAELPDLTELPGVVRVTEPTTATLVATYVDTDDLALVRHGVTLRRRTGGDDAGWHLKVPAGLGRDELHRPLGRTETVPAGLARQVLGWTRGRDLRPVADVETLRTARLLLDAEDAVLAEVADDRVTGRAVGRLGADAVTWREVEVELVTAPPAFLDAADAPLAAAGILPRTVQRKIASVLAHRLPEPAEALTRRALDGPASAVLHARLAEQVAALLRADCDVRRGVDDGVRRLRVASRRLRAALATFGPLLDRDRTDPLRAELRWVARTLGAGRDAEVAQDRLRALVSEVPRRQVVGPVRRRIDRTHADRRRAAGTHAADVLASRRYLRLLGRLDRLVASPAWSERADRPAAEVLPKRVRKDLRRLREAVGVAEAVAASDGAGPAHDEALHDVRKAAKRLRHACEVLEPLWGSDARRLRKAAQDVTRVLGERQDTVVVRADLRRMAARATADGESAFTYGVLHEREQSRASVLEGELAAAWGRLDSKKLRRWLG
ncbi:CYTH and CHAD domain-containing protein [Nocardioides dongxiaopingii]|uniref:CYTH and CHAD domain-containing protein n=1 Tax=Nocardioides sp. S-1144 TaxID=2582905 RepID=UPI00110E380E|nr:CYTH and CHAD domain-containing protein [Nocardioides sp. S-1144]